MGQIVLEGIELYAYHGALDEEQVIGNKYGIDLYIHTDLKKAAQSDNLLDTINYFTAYQIISEEMKIKSRLLENVAYRILKRIKNQFPEIDKTTIHISKFNPPVGGVVAKSKVILEL